MKYTKNTDLIKSPAVLTSHLHSHGLLEVDSSGQAEPLEIKGQERRLKAEDDLEEGQPILVDTGPPPEAVEDDCDQPEEPEEYYHGLDELPWSLTALEQALYLSLPAWVHAALLCNILEHVVRPEEPGFSLPVRLMSYLLLPYTLPASAIFQLNYRFMRLAYWEKTNLLKSFRGVQENVHWRKWNRRLQEKTHWLSWIRGLHEKSYWPEWMTDLQEKAQWLWWDVKQVVRLLVKVSVSSLKTMLPDRFPSLPIPSPRIPTEMLKSLHFIPLSLSIPSVSLCSLSFLTPSLLMRVLPSRFFSFGSSPQSEPGQASGIIQSRRRSTLRFHLSTNASAADPMSPTEPPRKFSLLLNLQLEVDEQPEVEPVLPALPSPLKEAQLSAEEVEDEGLCSPHISYLAVREEDARDEDSDVEDSVG